MRSERVAALLIGALLCLAACGAGDEDKGADTSASSADGGGTVVECEGHEACIGKLAGAGPETCFKAICSAVGKCIKAALADGGPCDDGQSCTESDTCTGGQCIGKSAACASSDVCLVGSCVDGKGCVDKPLPDGTKCDDGVYCTGDDRCDAGECSPGNVLSCDDNNPCTDDDCLIAAACKNSPTKPGTTCDDGDLCTEKDVCLEGQCVGGSGGEAENNPCLLVSCDAVTGKKTITNMPDATPCKDGESCTWGDACVAGKCVGKAVDCDVAGSCIKGVCDGVTGGCMFTPAPNSTSCDDGDVCTAVDVCLGGNCAGTGDSGVVGCGAQSKCGFGKPVAGCDTCFKEDFAFVYPNDWSAYSEDPDWIDWSWDSVKKATSANALAIAWKDAPPGGGSGFVDATYTHRNRYLHAGGPAPTLRFKLAMTVADPGCVADTLTLFANGLPVMQRCGSGDPSKFDPAGFETVEVDLGALRGGPLQLMFRVRASTAKGTQGSIHIDAIELVGDCSEACVAAPLERQDLTVRPTPFPLPVLPQPWRRQSSSPDYVAWKWAQGDAHGGKGKLQVQWQGSPPGGVKQVASLLIPDIQPVVGSKLQLALRATKVGAAGCAADMLQVRVGDKTVHQQCNVQDKWQVLSFDLSGHAGASVDVLLEAVTGAGGGSAGAFEIDDVSVTGSCKYACFKDDFDTDGLGSWLALLVNDEQRSTSSGDVERFPGFRRFTRDFS